MPDDLDLNAAGLRSDDADLGAFVEALAVRLEGALGDRAAVERRGDGFLGRGEKRVRRIAVDLSGDAFSLERDGRTVTPLRATTVRGITIRNEELPLGDWVRALDAAIAERAGTSADARSVLADLLA